MTSQKKSSRLTDAELEILKVLWELGPSTVREVHAASQSRKPSQYTTTLRVMQIMTDKRLLIRDESDRAHVYSPTVERENVQREMVSSLIDRVFGGSAESLLIGALSARPASKKELARMRQMLDEHERGKRKP
jgi:predicted transcriptional regulator